MANRRSHKKLRADVRARMLRTGESYQSAQNAILRARAAPPAIDVAMDVDLVPIEYFGVRLTLATFEMLERLVMVVLTLPGEGRGRPIPSRPLDMLARWAPRDVN